MQFWKHKTPDPPVMDDDLRSETMRRAITRWEDIFSGRPDWVTPKHPDSLNLASAVTRYLARLVCAELDIRCTGSVRAQTMQRLLQQQVVPQLPAALEQAMAGGCAVLRPYVSGGRLFVEWLRADAFYPIEQTPDGRVCAAAFLEQRTHNGREHLRIETHRLHRSGSYEITQRVYELRDGRPGRELSLSELPAWSALAPEVHIEGQSVPLFAVLRMPFANTVDGSGQPVSLYASAVDTLRDLDRLYGDYRFEFASARRKLLLREDALRLRADGSVVLPQEEGAADVYLPLDFGPQTQPFGDYTPAIREEAYRRGIQELLRLFELQTGVSPGTFSLEDSGQAVTATEILSKDRKTYYTVHELQSQLRQSVHELAQAIDSLLTLYRLCGHGAWELAVEFGDSVFEDTATEFDRRRQLVELGMRPELLLAWYFKTTQEQAARMLRQEGEHDGAFDMDAGAGPAVDRPTA